MVVGEWREEGVEKERGEEWMWMINSGGGKADIDEGREYEEGGGKGGKNGNYWRSCYGL